MSKKIYDNEIGASSSDTADYDKQRDSSVVLRVVGDSNSSDLTVETVEGRLERTESAFDSLGDTESYATQDLTTDDNNTRIFRFTQVDGLESVRFQFSTGSLANPTSIQVYAEGFDN